MESLDSLGHMHEALAGDYYHEEMESVPEQTWSSATFFAAAVHGMLGLQIDGASSHVTFTPHLPPTWNSITLRNIKAGASEVSLHMTQTPSEIRLQAHNEGAPVQIKFDPEIPFGAKVRSAQLRTRRITAETEPHPQDTHAKIEFDLPHGDTSLAINYTGGVAILPDAPTLAVGDPNHAIKITATHLDGRAYTVDFDVLPSAPSTLDLRTLWKIENAEGATFQQIGPSLYRLTINPPKEEDSQSYQHGQLKLTFARDGFD